MALTATKCLPDAFLRINEEEDQPLKAPCERPTLVVLQPGARIMPPSPGRAGDAEEPALVGDKAGEEGISGNLAQASCVESGSNLQLVAEYTPSKTGCGMQSMA